MKTLIYFAFFIFQFSIFISCLPKKSEKELLLAQGIKQSAKYSENFLNFYYENNIERSEAEYPEYYAKTAEEMRKIWQIYAPFDEILGNFEKNEKKSKKEIFSVYANCLDSLNSLLLDTDTLFETLKFNKNLDKKTAIFLYKNHLENTKNKFLRKLIKAQPKQIQKKNYYAFQLIETTINQDNNNTELYFHYIENKVPYTSEILIDSITSTKKTAKTSYFIDNSLIFGKINIQTNQKGNYFIYGKVKISGQNGFSLIPFKEKFEIY